MRLQIPELGLGTANFGAAYNNCQPPSDAELHAMLAYARDHGVTYLDTAAGYGAAEERVGNWLKSNPHDFKIIGKFHKLSDIDKSLAALGIDQFDTLLHHVPAFPPLRAHPQAQHLGVSVYSADDVHGMGLVDTLMVPASVVDQRYKEWARARAQRVIGRSIFCKGRISPNIALPFIRQRSQLDVAIMGCRGLADLKENLSIWAENIDYDTLLDTRAF